VQHFSHIALAVCQCLVIVVSWGHYLVRVVEIGKGPIWIQMNYLALQALHEVRV